MAIVLRIRASFLRSWHLTLNGGVSGRNFHAAPDPAAIVTGMSVTGADSQRRRSSF
jgi:hypothetical protein